MKFVDTDGNCTNTELYPDAAEVGDELVSLSKLNHEQKSQSSFSSSSSVSSSEEDFFQLDPNELSKSVVEIDDIETNEIPSNTPKILPNLDEDAQLTPTFDAEPGPDHTSITFGGFSPSVAADTHYASIRSDQVSKVNPFSDVTPGGLTENYSLLSPPIQVMGKFETADPYRIPFSVFESKPATPMDWSVASNESLFSIHVGNTSFSRDHVFLVGRSGELGLTPDGSAQTSVTVDFEPSNLNFGEGLEDPRMSEAAVNAETMADLLRAAAAAVDVNEKESHSEARPSDSSGTSAMSFAFPILPGGEKIGSMKMESKRMQKHRSQIDKSRSHEVIPIAAKTKWFTCFGRCSLSLGCC